MRGVWGEMAVNRPKFYTAPTYIKNKSIMINSDLPLVRVPFSFCVSATKATSFRGKLSTGEKKKQIQNKRTICHKGGVLRRYDAG